VGDGDEHLSDRLANDRTYLAWLRTGIALAGLGFVVAKFGVFLREFARTGVPHSGLSGVVGILLVAAGAALMVVGYLEHRRVAGHIDRRTGSANRPVPAWPVGVSVGACLGASAVLVVLLAVTGSA